MTQTTKDSSARISSWWKHSCLLIMAFGFSVLIWLAARTYQDAPPIPLRVVDPAGGTLFTLEDILEGQQVFLKYGLMENGSIWGHGAYLGPDFSAAYLHNLATDGMRLWSQEKFGRPRRELSDSDQAALAGQVSQLLKHNRYDSFTGVLNFTDVEQKSYLDQLATWRDYFSNQEQNSGLPHNYINNPTQLRALTAFFAWTAWASVANRPGKPYSYTNNFPYDPLAGNTPTGDAVLWSALSLIPLLGGTALILLAFGRFDFLGWRGRGEHIHPKMIPGLTSPSQRATIKYFVVAALLFLAQSLAGGATAHYRADPAGFFGMDVSRIFPSNLLRTWHLQLSIFWVATAYIAGGLLLAPALGKGEAPDQRKGINTLFGTLVLIVLGSSLGEAFGLKQLLGKLWFWIGHQGWEYLDLGRAWQILLAAALVSWLFMLFRAIGKGRKDPEYREIAPLFLYSAIAIPLFYLPALFFDGTSHFSVVDTWRFWIIHLWVEGFFELFVTVIVSTIFFKLGMVTQQTAARVVYLDAILYLGSGIIGTGHHWYWTGQSHITMALAAAFSAMEVIPVTLLTLDAWDFVKLTKGTCDVCRQPVSVPHKWTFYFLMAVGFWNFIGAGLFGFLINLPIVSYFEVGTLLTPNHGHAAMMGVFGMLAIALMVFSFRQSLSDDQWPFIEKLVRISFFGLNAGLGLMVVTNLFPGGVLQLLDVLRNGYWHARGPEFLTRTVMSTLEWFRLPGDLIFILFGALPLSLAAVLTYWHTRKGEPDRG